VSAYEYVVLGIIGLCIVAIVRGWRRTDDGMRSPDEAERQRHRALTEDYSGRDRPWGRA